MANDDEFTIYDLKVEWLAGKKPCWCGAKQGDHFTLEGENIHFPAGQSWSIYTLAALIPLGLCSPTSSEISPVVKSTPTVPDTKTQSPSATAREYPAISSNTDPDEISCLPIIFLDCGGL